MATAVKCHNAQSIDRYQQLDIFVANNTKTTTTHKSRTITSSLKFILTSFLYGASSMASTSMSSAIAQLVLIFRERDIRANACKVPELFSYMNALQASFSTLPILLMFLLKQRSNNDTKNNGTLRLQFSKWRQEPFSAANHVMIMGITCCGAKFEK